MLAAALFLFAAAGWPNFDLPDAKAGRHTAAEFADAKAVVFLFVGTECPVSNSYSIELQKLFADYSSKQVVFLGVNSELDISSAAVRLHAEKFGLPFPVLLDPKQTLARKAGATITPQAAVYSPQGKLLYLGRIDDRVADLGAARPEPNRRDLRIALDQILAGQPVSEPATRAFGCTIEFTREAAPTRATKGVNYARDIAPLLNRSCVVCHREGGAGPFPLQSYQQASARAQTIAQVAKSGFMPPWLPARGDVEFEGAKRLSAKEKALLSDWAKAGAPEGDESRAPTPPEFPDGWQLGVPDLVVKLPQGFPIPAEGGDVYQCFALPLGPGQEKYVRAIELRPSNRKVAHHALLFQDTTGTARKRDTGQGYPCFGLPGFLPVRGLGGWTPGGEPIRRPPEVPATLRPGSDLVLQMHYHPTGKPEEDQPSVGLYFTDRPPTRYLMEIPLGSNDIDIPAGAAAYKVRDHFELPVAVEAIGINPHAHYICKEMKVWATLPGGHKKQILWIPSWNFNWQEQYRFAAPLTLPAGTLLELEFSYDNSAANPHNPNRPPKRVVWGLGSGDEMAGAHLQVMPLNQEDTEELGRALWGKTLRTTGWRWLYRKPN
jgi:peroxiredoxin